MTADFKKKSNAREKTMTEMHGLYLEALGDREFRRKKSKIKKKKKKKNVDENSRRDHMFGE